MRVGLSTSSKTSSFHTQSLFLFLIFVICDLQIITGEDDPAIRGGAVDPLLAAGAAVWSLSMPSASWSLSREQSGGH